MTASNSPHLDCPTDATDRRHAAPQPVGRAAVGEPTGAARQGVVTAIRSDPRTARSRHPQEGRAAA
ncbi:hypothetical protein GEV49_21600 [Streptomyces sp. SYP-A7193]|nr:hypothetical protein GEV49_21600 [Streptomyces sp. SYP-A7193]